VKRHAREECVNTELEAVPFVRGDPHGSPELPVVLRECEAGPSSDKMRASVRGIRGGVHTVMYWVYAAALDVSRQFCMVARWLRH